MKRRQLESRILIIIALVLLFLLYLVSESTVKSLLPLFSVIYILPSRMIDSVLMPVPEELHKIVYNCIGGDYENLYQMIDSELIPEQQLINLEEEGLIPDEYTGRILYPFDLIKIIKVLPTAHKKDMLPETLIKSDYKQNETIRIGELIIND